MLQETFDQLSAVEGSVRDRFGAEAGAEASLADTLDPTRKTLSVAPSHTIATRASLLFHAGISHEQAMVISELDGAPLVSPDGFDQAMHDARASLTTDAVDLSEG